MNRLDVRSLLQDDAIEHVEMGEAGDSVGGDKVDTASDQNLEEEEVRWRGGAGLYCGVREDNISLLDIYCGLQVKPWPGHSIRPIRRY